VSQHDYIISNASGATVRADINSVLAAIITNNSGATAPSTSYSYQFWADTTTGILKQRNAANSAWIDIGTMASTNLGLAALAGATFTGALLAAVGTVSLPGLAFSGDADTGIYRQGANALGLVAGATEYLRITSLGGDFLGTGQVKVPVGTTAQRTGSPATGMIRYNSTLGFYEGYKASAWETFGTLSGSARAWVNFNGTGTVAIRDSFNVTSITDSATGTYLVNFTTAMSNANYCVTASHGGVSGVGTGEIHADTFATGSFKLRTNNSSGAAATDMDPICAAVHAN